MKTPPTIILTSVEPGLAYAWEQICGDLKNVEIVQGSILNVNCEAVVSPANSFGFMDGGIDALYTRYFGEQLQERLQQLIREKHHGELLVGSAAIAPTQNQQIPYLIAAPTMRVPMVLNNSVNPYLAARAVLLLILNGSFPDGQPIADVVKRMAFPGLGTGVGQVSFSTCSAQVRQAIEEVCFDRGQFPESWVEASQRHQALYGQSFRDLQRD
ncbi:macro domain-containing protein [Microscilla marina]|uniref:Gifsy-1 prophage protein n=1 Tax=Microscilla marina ATCC 23134 TaxID=313606 RepID=A1ZNT6_MICM2|nr:macro domain-containing protein [Microscilla marina]EAY27975.1 gifsy-1 prophage protein [Microscilla marina ATCC 23134]